MPENVTLRRFCGEGYAARLQRDHGFEVVGRGGGVAFGGTIVLARSGSDAVVKVGSSPAGDPWPLYAAHCLQHPGPFKPAVRHLAWHGKGISRFFVATMDRLTAVNWPAHQPLILALHHWYEMLIAHDIDYRRMGDGENDPRPAAWLVTELIRFDLPDIAAFVRELAETFPGPMLDPQPCNWMVSGDGRLVMIDPFSRTVANVPETAPRLLRRA